MRLQRALVLAASTFALAAAPASAAPGDFDAAFGDGAPVFVNFGGTDRAAAVARQADGKYVIAGIWDGGAPDIAVTRLNPDGSPDKTFSGDGQANVFFGDPPFGKRDLGAALAIQPDGRIVVAGGTTNNSESESAFDFAVVRLTPGGELDNTFAGDGRQTIDFGGSEVGNAVALTADGDIVIGGEAVSKSGKSEFAIARLKPNGLLSAGFGTDGRAKVPFDLIAGLSDLVLDDLGRIVAVGTTTGSDDADFALARLLPNGKPDNSFDSDGRTTAALSEFDDRASAVAIQPDGNIVVTGTANGEPGIGDSGIARFKPNGNVDNSFSGDGVVVAAFGGKEQPASVDVTPGGRLAVTGQVDGDLLAASFNADGSPDTGFSGDGRAVLDAGGNDDGFADALVDGRRLVAVGGGRGTKDFAAAAFEIDLKPPPPPAPDPGGSEPPNPGGGSESPGPAGGGGPVGEEQPPVGRDALAPVLSKLKLKAKRFRRSKGTRGTIKVSENATVVLRIERRKGKKLVAARTLRIPLSAGTGRFKLSRLKVGSYRLTAIATDASGNASKPVRTTFRVRR